MLKSLKKSSLRQVGLTHTDLYVEHYDSLKRWARQFTEQDQELAEDLLHDAFIQFTLSRPDLETIQNPEGYLFILMRNLHLSQLRKASRTPLKPIAVVDFDTVDMSFWASDPRDQIRLRDELAAVCQYACLRKESAKVGSVLILRFFHGYYPEEIGQVLRSNALSATKRLKVARAEARLFLEAPERLSFFDVNSRPLEKPNISHFGDDLRLELRRQIFASRQGDCLTQDDLAELYTSEPAQGIDQRTVAHIVSCQMCIEAVNSLLDLPPLSSRYSLDTLGNDPGKKGGSGGGSGGAGGPKMLDSLIKRREAHFHHQPEELCVAVNGQPQSFQKVVSGKGELTLVIDTDESLGFVEVFSEIGLRLLMLNVEPPPVGDGKQAVHVDLSGGRTLAANLNFSGPFPTLQISYNDPQLAEVLALENTPEEPKVESVPLHVPFEDSKAAISFIEGLRMWLSPLPIAVAATVLISVLAAIWFVRQPPVIEPPNARVVLKEAREAEFALAPTTDKVLHRNYQVEEWSNGKLQSRRRVDAWQKKTVSVRRTYDEQGQLIAGLWTRENGLRQVFKQGERLKTVPKAEQNDHDELIRNSEPTANAFANLIDYYGVASKVTLEETAAAYIFNFRDEVGETDQAKMPNRLLVASLTLDRNNLMPRSQTLVLQVGDEKREYYFTDIRLEQKPALEVSPLIFEPEAELSKGATKVTKPLEIGIPVPTTIEKASTSANTAANPVVNPGATLETEVEVFKALDGINALSGDQISITRTTAGQLKVSGIVDSVQRKTEILTALGGLRNTPGLTIDVQTATEAASRQRQSGDIKPIEIDTTRTESDRQLPVEAELKAYFEKRGLTGEKLNAEITVYAGSILQRSDSLRRNALSLKRLAERFSPAEFERLDEQKRQQWESLLRSKAAAIAGDARSLSSQLSAVGLGGGGDGGDGATIRNASDVAQAAQRLFGLGVECDAQIRQSFSISRGGTASVKTVQFWRNLHQIADIAAGIQKF